MTLEEAETLALSTLKQVMEEKVHSDEEDKIQQCLFFCDLHLILGCDIDGTMSTVFYSLLQKSEYQ